MLENKLLKYLNYSGGSFIELGALDGNIQSNTKFLEDDLGWSGILIEPSYNNFLVCKKNRSKNYIFNLACVSSDYSNDKIFGDFHGSPMSSVNGKRLNSNNLLSVDVDTLGNIIKKCSYSYIDFLSLDVEGYELEVLKGVDFNKITIKYVLIEVYEKDKGNIFNYMKNNGYEMLENVSCFTKETHPNWDGTHNDYLFIKKIYDIHNCTYGTS